MSVINAFAHDSNDDAERRREKDAIFVVAGGCTICGVIWAAMYWAVFGWGLTAALPGAFVVIVGGALVVAHTTKNHYYAVFAQIICIVYITAFIQWSIGGVFDSGLVMAWAFIGPVTALMFFRLRWCALWMALYVVNVIVTAVFDETFRRHGLDVSADTKVLFFAMNLCMSSLVIFYFASYFVRSASTERLRADALQHDIDDLTAKQLGPYTLEEKLGQGGMGVVYRASHALLRRATAIKLLSEKRTRPEQVERFEREVQLTSELNHPNIVAIYDYGHSPDGDFYYAMEHLPGVDLEMLVDEVGALPPARAVGILRQIAEALDAAHDRGLIHRDIKPSNIILSRFGKRADVVKVLDFGLVREINRDEKLTAENVISGTPAYLAPETLTEPDAVGPAVDIYAYGAVAYFLLTGETPFSGKTFAEICAHHIHTPAPVPSAHSARRIPPALDQLVSRCLAKDPVGRFPSATAMVEALDAITLDDTWTTAEGLRWWDAYDRDADKPDAKTSNEVSRPTVTIERRR